MRFDNEFDVAGTPPEVIALFDDLPLMASFLPGASVGEANPDGTWPATLVVAFGPKRIAFKGKLTNDVDRPNLAGMVTGNASADMRGAKMSVTMNYRLAQCPAGTRVTLVSEAEMTGILAEFARTGGVVLTNALLAEFAGRFSAHVAARRPQLAGTLPAAAPLAAAEALPAGALLAQVVKSALRALGHRLKSALRGRG